MYIVVFKVVVTKVIKLEKLRKFVYLQGDDDLPLAHSHQVARHLGVTRWRHAAFTLGMVCQNKLGFHVALKYVKNIVYIISVKNVLLTV